MSASDLSKAPAPKVIEELKYEEILEQMISDLKARDPNLNLSDSDPALIVLQTAAYREFHLRLRINNAAISTMLAYGRGTDLDNFGWGRGVLRKKIKDSDLTSNPPTEAVYESDDDYRHRIRLMLHSISTAGSIGSYEYHALSADPDVADVDISSSKAGTVDVTVLSHSNNYVPTESLLNKVDTLLNAETVRPLTDTVKVHAAKIIEYSIDATLYFYEGPDKSIALNNANKTLQKYIKSVSKLGHDITISGIHAALHQSGVQRVQLISPTNNIIIDHDSAARCINVNIIDGGIDE